MSAKDLAIDVLLGAGVSAQLICCLGVLLARDAFARLHYSGAASIVGPLLVMAAVIVDELFNVQGLETIAAVALLALPSPIVVHATARAARRAYFDQVEAMPGELEGGAR
jgi:multisubunit Na+/H+ antiporter MnhG subunit